jgi:NTP pyrophosphatase (non-canonical NTP hydrolase)
MTNAFDEYQTAAMCTAEYPNRLSNLVYPAMGVAGEAGEFCDKVKKMWRNTGEMSVHTSDRLEMVKELGDVLWYIAACAAEMDIPLSEVAQININKLLDRRARGVIKSEGDNR